MEGGSASVHAGIPPPPLARQTSPLQGRHPLGRQTSPWQGRPLSCQGDSPCTMHAGRYGQQAGSMHPTGMQSCFKIWIQFENCGQRILW